MSCLVKIFPDTAPRCACFKKGLSADSVPTVITLKCCMGEGGDAIFWDQFIPLKHDSRYLWPFFISQCKYCSYPYQCLIQLLFPELALPEDILAEGRRRTRKTVY